MLGLELLNFYIYIGENEYVIFREGTWPSSLLIKLTHAFSFQTLGSCLNMLFPCRNWEACRLVLLVYKTFTNLLHMDEVSMSKLSNSTRLHSCSSCVWRGGSGPTKLLSSVYLSWCQQQQQRWPWSWTSPHQAMPCPAPPSCAVHTQTRKIILLST